MIAATRQVPTERDRSPWWPETRVLLGPLHDRMDYRRHLETSEPAGE